MRVKVEFNVELDEIPSEVVQRLQKINKSNYVSINSLEEISRLIGDGAYIKACDLITDTRKKMSDQDLLLQDAYTILMGYANFKTKPERSSTEKIQEQIDEIAKQVQNG